MMFIISGLHKGTSFCVLFVYFLCTSRQTIRSFLLFFLEDPFIFSIFATNNAKFEMSPGKIGTVPIFPRVLITSKIATEL